jgi:hypothetical protein
MISKFNKEMFHIGKLYLKVFKLVDFIHQEINTFYMNLLRFPDSKCVFFQAMWHNI